MNKSANVTVELDDDAYAAFKEASEIVLKSGHSRSDEPARSNDD